MIRKFFFGGLLFFGSYFCVDAQEGRTVKTIEEKNKEADRAFIIWKVRGADTEVSDDLQIILTDEAIDYLVDKSELPFYQILRERELREKIDTISKNFLKLFGPESPSKALKRDLKKLLNAIIIPEMVFQPDEEEMFYKLDRVYNKTLSKLQARKTFEGTTLRDWAIRFLISEALIIALAIVERVEINGKTFNQMTPREQEAVLEPVVDVVVNRFGLKLNAVKGRFKLSLPGRVDDAIGYKVRTFLHDKFIER